MTIRVFHEHALDGPDHVRLAADESHYAVRVRRARVGTAVEVLDGRSGARRGVVELADDRGCTVALGEHLSCPAIDPLELWLGLPDPSAALESITAACELAATRIVLVRCRYSPTAVPTPERIARVVRAAQRQCGRPVPPEITAPVDLATLLATTPPPLGAYAWEELRDVSPTTDALDPTTARRLLVGPEGGLADDEAAACRGAGMHAIALGPWTLRTQTAVAAGLARIQSTARSLPRS